MNGIGLTTPTETLFSDQIVRPRKIQLSKGNIRGGSPAVRCSGHLGGGWSLPLIRDGVSASGMG